MLNKFWQEIVSENNTTTMLMLASFLAGSALTLIVIGLGFFFGVIFELLYISSLIVVTMTTLAGVVFIIHYCYTSQKTKLVKTKKSFRVWRYKRPF